ncbi:MAG: response regulator [Betaproteobacteria bacterium]|nr:response regulator [Betaproteobacteria bacterium]
MNTRTSIFEISPSSTIRPAVLVVDDPSDTLSLLCEGISAAGYIVIPAKNSDEALECLEFATPDIILLDATSPNVGGFALCRRIKSMPGRSEIPILFMVELANNDQIINSFENGGSDYISKPVRIPEVLARLLTRIVIRLNAR